MEINRFSSQSVHPVRYDKSRGERFRLEGSAGSRYWRRSAYASVGASSPRDDAPVPAADAPQRSQSTRAARAAPGRTCLTRAPIAVIKSALERSRNDAPNAMHHTLRQSLLTIEKHHQTPQGGPSWPSWRSIHCPNQNRWVKPGYPHVIVNAMATAGVWAGATQAGRDLLAGKVPDAAIIAMIMSRVRLDGVATDPGEADVWANGNQFEGIDRQQWDQQHRHALGCLSIH